MLTVCALSVIACSGADGSTPAIGDDIDEMSTDAPESASDAVGIDDDGSEDLTSDAGPTSNDVYQDTSTPAQLDAAPPEDTAVPTPEDDAADEPVTPPEEVPWLDDPVWQCENGVPISVVVDVVIPANAAGCPWNEGGNLGPIQGAFAAHQMTTVSAELPGPSQAICSVNLNSADFDPDFEQPFIYDDHFILVFNDVVLLSSYGDLMSALPTERNWYLFDWSAIAGAGMSFNNSSAYCLGYGGEDNVVCSIPSPESNGPVAYSIDGGLGKALSSRAVQQQRVEFSLATFGDNDPDSDCRNSELRMQLVIDYVIAP
ncbi:MAG: hypothetical protein ACPGU1_08885 [Myxococcota bacterium]